MPTGRRDLIRSVPGRLLGHLLCPNSSHCSKTASASRSRSMAELTQLEPAAAPPSTIPDAGGTSPGSTTAPPGYDLLDEVGHGGMGVVFRARDLELNREVAVKVLQPRYAIGSAMAAR